MTSLLTPPRRRGREILDQPGVEPALQRRSLDDVARCNTLFGGANAVISELRPLLRRLRGGSATLLDVGSGLGDIPARVARVAAARGVRLATVGVDCSEVLAAATRERTTAAVRADALALPFPDGSVDFVTCSQVLHHFGERDARRVIREMHRVARHRVIVSDIRRSWVAAAGLWLVSFPLRFHPVSRHDGVVSVMRGFTPAELSELVRRAIHRPPTTRRRWGFRVTASWSPAAPGEDMDG